MTESKTATQHGKKLINAKLAWQVSKFCHGLFFFFFLQLHSDETFLIGFWWKSKCFKDHFRLLHHLTLQIFNICFINVKKVVLCRISGAFCFNGTHSQMSLKSCWSVITQNILESNASISSSFFLFFFAIEAKIDRGKNVRWKKLT